MKVKGYTFNNYRELEEVTSTLYSYKFKDEKHFHATYSNKKWIEEFCKQYGFLIEHVQENTDINVYVVTGINYTLYVLNNGFWIESELTGYFISDTREIKDIGNFIKEKFNPEKEIATIKDLIDFLNKTDLLEYAIEYRGEHFTKNALKKYLYDSIEYGVLTLN